jgi:hypothetical protein
MTAGCLSAVSAQAGSMKAMIRIGPLQREHTRGSAS